MVRPNPMDRSGRWADICCVSESGIMQDSARQMLKRTRKRQSKQAQKACQRKGTDKHVHARDTRIEGWKQQRQRLIIQRAA